MSAYWARRVRGEGEGLPFVGIADLLGAGILGDLENRIWQTWLAAELGVL